VIALAEPGFRLDDMALAVDHDPATIDTELLCAGHMLGHAPAAAAEMRFFLMWVHRRDEFEIEDGPDSSAFQHQPMPAQAFEHDDLQRANFGRQCLWAQPARSPKGHLPGPDGDPGETIHHVAIGVARQGQYRR